MRRLFLILLIAACLPSLPASAAAQSRGREAEEYAVYRAALSYLYSNDVPAPVVVSGGWRDTLDDFEVVHRERREPGLLPPALVADHRARARALARNPADLDASGVLPLRVIAVPDSVQGGRWGDAAWWRAFSDRYQGATDLVKLGQVGFLPDRSMALVWIVRFCHCTDSGGLLLLMRREGSTWKVAAPIGGSVF